MSEQTGKAALIQWVWITFSDGSRVAFSGEACVFPGDPRVITDISFTPPKPLPERYSLEKIEETEGPK